MVEAQVVGLMKMPVGFMNMCRGGVGRMKNVILTNPTGAMFCQTIMTDDT